MPSFARNAVNYYLMQRDYGLGAKSRHGMQRTRSSTNPKIDSDLSRALERLALREETSYDDSDIYASSSSGPESPSYMYASDTHRRRHNLRSILKAPPPPLSKGIFKKASDLNKDKLTRRRSAQRNNHKVTFTTDSDSEDCLTEEEREMRKKVEDYNRFQRAQREERQRADIIQLSNFKSKEDRDSYDRELAMQDYYARCIYVFIPYLIFASS